MLQPDTTCIQLFLCCLVVLSAICMFSKVVYYIIRNKYQVWFNFLIAIYSLTLKVIGNIKVAIQEFHLSM